MIVGRHDTRDNSRNNSICWSSNVSTDGGDEPQKVDENSDSTGTTWKRCSSDEFNHRLAWLENEAAAMDWVT